MKAKFNLLSDLGFGSGRNGELRDKADEARRDRTGSGEQDERAEKNGAAILAFRKADDALTKRNMTGHGE